MAKSKATQAAEQAKAAAKAAAEQAQAAAQALETIQESVEVLAQSTVASQTQVASQTPAVDSITSGRVKWFNNKAGYGFITVTDCETNEERDIFVHHSEIKVDQSQYKYLVQGEYVEFVIGAISRDNKLDVHATSVRGINSGKLMCETRNETRSYRSAQPYQAQQTQAQQTQAQQTQAQQTQAPAPVKQQAQPPSLTRQMTRQAPTASQPKHELRRPQLDKADQSEWMVVPRRRLDAAPSKQKTQPRQRQPVIEIAQ